MRRLALVALTAAMTIVPAGARAQENVSYANKRNELVRQLNETQKSLDALRSDRTNLAARIDNVMARLAQQRALALTLSNEQNSLVQIDSLLTSAQDNLGSQHDRLLALGDALRRNQGGMLVVLFRADSATGNAVAGATLAIDGAAPTQRSYTGGAAGALQLGAVDEVFRGSVLPTSHQLAFTATVNGQPVSNSVTVATSGDAVTYVQFAVRNGQLVTTTWTSRSTTPF